MPPLPQWEAFARCGRIWNRPVRISQYWYVGGCFVGGGLGFGGSKPPALRCCGLIKRLVECGRIWNRPYGNVSCGLIRFVVRCGTPRMSSPTMWMIAKYCSVKRHTGLMSKTKKSQKSPLENQRGFFTADLLYVWDNWQTWLQKSFC